MPSKTLFKQCGQWRDKEYTEFTRFSIRALGQVFGGGAHGGWGIFSEDELRDFLTFGYALGQSNAEIELVTLMAHWAAIFLLRLDEGVYLKRVNIKQVKLQTLYGLKGDGVTLLIWDAKTMLPGDQPQLISLLFSDTFWSPSKLLPKNI